MAYAMHDFHTARSAQMVCAASACPENTLVLNILMDAVLASIFALISLLGIRILGMDFSRDLTNRRKR